MFALFALGATMTNKAVYAGRVFWVNGGLDDSGKAVDESPTSLSVTRETLIWVKAGTYDRGEGRTMNSHVNRVEY